MLPLAVIGAAEVDRHLPGAVRRIADRLAAPVAGLRHLADQRPALAVLALRAGLLAALAAHALARMAVGVAHPTGERGAARGQGAAGVRRREAGRQRHRGASGATLGPAVLQPVQDRDPSAAIGMRRGVDRPVVAARALERRGRQVDQQRVLAIAGLQPAQRPRGLPAGRGRRHGAGPRHRPGRFLENVRLQAPPRRLDRVRVAQRLLAVDPLVRRHLSDRLGSRLHRTLLHRTLAPSRSLQSQRIVIRSRTVPNRGARLNGEVGIWPVLAIT